MAQRGNWDRLSSGYRARLERGGITRSGYESGESLSGARGHSHTPERPIPKGQPVPKVYKKWFNNRYGTPIKMLTTDGEKILVGVSRKQRNVIAAHWNAVNAKLYGWRGPRWQGDILAPFDAKNIRGSSLNDDGSIDPREVFYFMTEWEEIVDWAHEDGANFGDIYQLSAA